MVSEIRTNKISSRAGLSTVRLTDTGPVFSGIATFTDTDQFDVNNLNAIGIVTATNFYGDGSNLTGITANIPGISTTGISVFQDIDVDGHTNLDNVSIAGVGTFGGQMNHFGPKISGSGSDNGISLLYNGVVGALTFYDGTSDGFIRSYGELFFLVNADQSTGYIGGGYGLRITSGFTDTPAGSLIPYTMNHGLPHLGRSAARFGTVFSEQGNYSGVVTATSFVGDGSQLTNIDPTPAGANTQIQYNNNGAFGASGSLTFDGSMLEVAGIISATSSPSGTEGLRKVYASTSSPSGGADGDLWLKYDTSPVTSYLPSTGGTATGNIVIQNASLQITNTNATAGNYLEMKTNADSSVSLDKVGDGAFNIGGHNIYLKHDTTNQYYAGFEYNGKSYLNYNGTTKIETQSYGVIVSGEVRDSLGDLRSLPQNNTSGSYTLTATDAGKHVRATGQITIPSGTFSTGDMITIYNNSGSAIDIIQGSSTTVYNSNDASTGNKSLKARGLCTILCESNNAFVASGNFA
tara:strand:+ start:161 stop:1720 length:1560 start_codon:yes stop_codon:yes gene_type:complete